MQNHLKPGKVKLDDLVLRSHHVNPNYSELQNYIDNFYTSYIKRMVEETEKFLMSQFERHGYSRDEVLSLAREGRIWISEGNERTRYWLDDEPLFEIILTEGLLEGYSYRRAYKCIDLKEE